MIEALDQGPSRRPAPGVSQPITLVGGAHQELADGAKRRVLAAATRGPEQGMCHGEKHAPGLVQPG